MSMKVKINVRGSTTMSPLTFTPVKGHMLKVCDEPASRAGVG